jgi:hypothetical protein
MEEVYILLNKTVSMSFRGNTNIKVKFKMMILLLLLPAALWHSLYMKVG